MDFGLFFNSLDETLFHDLTDTQSFYHHIRVYHEVLPDWQEADIAIVGVLEERGTKTNQGVALAANTIRQQLYRLKKGTGSYKIVDLGNLRNGINLEDTYLRLKEVCEYLLDRNIIPVILGGSHDVMIGQFLAYQHLDRIVSIANVDALLDLDENDTQGMNRHHLMKILTHHPNYLFNLTQLGLQTYLNSQKSLEILERLYFSGYGIGKIRDDINEIEPTIREADILSIDITAIRMDDAPANACAEPFGLTGEEICQICWFAGLSDANSSIGFYEYNPTLDVKNRTAKLIAVALWYFIEGYYHRRKELDFQSEAFLKYYVSIDQSDNEHYNLVFYKQTSTEKWWMEVSYPDSEMGLESCIIPCSYKDYQKAVDGDLPDRWLNTHAKLI